MLIFPGLFVIWNVIFNVADANNDTSRFQVKLPDLSLISTLFNMFIKPYINTLHFEPTFRTFDRIERTIERVVKQKIKQLRPFLQDNDSNETEMDDKFTFKGNDETTIIEFVPHPGEESKKVLKNANDTFKANMQRYKKVRNKIYEALDVEMVSDKTKILVMRTLDELLSKMVETQCQWKGGIEDAVSNNIETSGNKFIIPRTIVNMWRGEWHKFKTKFASLAESRAKDKGNNFNILMSYLTRLNNIINDVSMNLENFTKKYKIRCDVSERQGLSIKAASQNHDSYRLSYDTDNERKICENFKICSKELKAFFMDIYNSTNETAVNVLRSYAEMFTRDVNTDVSNEKNSIVEIVFKIADEIEKDIIKIFINHTNKFNLDKDKVKDANIRILTDFIKNLIQDTKQAVTGNLEVKLNHLHKKVSSSIQQDVAMNLGIELGNLERDLKGKICLVFNVCNGNPKSRRHNNDMDKENSIDNENRIYVRVELTVEDDFPDYMSHKFKTFKPTSVKTARIMNEFDSTRNYNAETKLLNYEKYANISVTRTTMLMHAL